MRQAIENRHGQFLIDPAARRSQHQGTCTGSFNAGITQTV